MSPAGSWRGVLTKRLHTRTFRRRRGRIIASEGRSVLILAHEPSLRLAFTAIAAGCRTGERRVAGVSTVQVLEGEVRFRAGEERHVLSVGGTLVLQGNVSYDADAVSDAAFLHTLVQPVEQGRDLPRPAHPMEPAGRRDEEAGHGFPTRTSVRKGEDFS
jgi:quercetin dioxygenase-like cupin family protein